MSPYSEPSHVCVCVCVYGKSHFNIVLSTTRAQSIPWPSACLGHSTNEAVLLTVPDNFQGGLHNSTSTHKAGVHRFFEQYQYKGAIDIQYLECINHSKIVQNCIY